MTNLDKLLTNKEIKERWLIQNLIGMGEIAVMYAPKDHHKTGMALKIAMEVITGGRELGASQSGSVSYMSLDTPHVEMMFRAKALMENKYPLHVEQIGSNLDINFNDRGNYVEDFNLLSDHYYYEYEDKEDMGGFNWYTAGDFDRGDGIRLVIIDTLSKAIVGGGINDDSQIRKAISNLRNWIKGSGDTLSILLIHHSGKDASRGMMGTSILSNDISTVLKIKKKKDGFELVREKSKSTLSGKSIPFKSRSVVINHNDELHESIYVDIGTGLDEFDAQIVEQFNKGLSKKEINGNTRLLGLGNNTTDKSFAVSFNRRWNKLIDTGFIENKKQDNKT
jgi:hypothetical protein